MRARDFAILLLVLAALPAGAEAGSIRFWQLKEAAAAPVLVVGRVLNVQKGELVPEGSVTWKAETLAMTATVQVFIQAMLSPQPCTLTFVAGEHFQFLIERRCDIDNEVGRQHPAKIVDSLNRIDVIKMRDFIERWGRVPAQRRIVGDRCVEAGIADEPAGHFVIAHVIDGRGGQHDVGTAASQSFSDGPPAFVIDDNA